MDTSSTRLPLLIAGILLATVLCAQQRETYTWVDPAGLRHYSDRPPPEDARQVRTLKVPLPGTASVPAASQLTSAPEPFSEDEESAQEATPPSVAIVQPTSEESFVNTGGRVPVSVEVQPQMPDQARVSIYLDGAVVATGTPGQRSFQLSPVYRGAHSVSAVLVGANGTRLARSSNVTFFVRQQSRLTPP